MNESKEVIPVDFGHLRLVMLAVGVILVFSGFSTVADIFAVASRSRTEAAIELAVEQNEKLLGILAEIKVEQRAGREISVAEIQAKIAEIKAALPLPLPVTVIQPLPLPVAPTEPIKKEK